MPSTAIAGNHPGPPVGVATGPTPARVANQAPTPSARCWAPSSANTRSTVSGCGGVNRPSASRRHSNAANTCGSAAVIHAVMSSNSSCPDVTAAVHSPRIEASEWRTPRRSRGSSIAAKHSNNPSAPAPASIVLSTPTCPTRTSTAAGSAAGSTPTTGGTDPAGMTDCTCNGATDQTKILRKSSSYVAPLPFPRDAPTATTP